MIHSNQALNKIHTTLLNIHIYLQLKQHNKNIQAIFEY